MVKVRSAFLSVVVLATFTLIPITATAADNSIQSNSQTNQSEDDTPWTFGQKTQGGSPFSRKSHQGVFYPTRDSKVKTPPPSPSKAGGQGPVTYHARGTIIENPNVYVIWYGNWDPKSCFPIRNSNSTPSILLDLVSNIGSSAWNEINATYYQVRFGEKTYVSPSIKYSGCTVDPGSQGLSLDGDTGPQVSDVVKNAINKTSLPNDPNGVFLVLSSSNVSVNGFLTDFCGYHDAVQNKFQTIKYSFIGDPSSNPASCESQPTVSPNGNVVADAMANILAHELIEPISDPLGLSWYDELGLENADKCAWTYGTVVKAADGSYSNMTIGGRKFLIQQNVPANMNICVSSVPGRGFSPSPR